jgi:hypothetical protein
MVMTIIKIQLNINVCDMKFSWEDQDYDLTGCYTVQFDTWVPVFWRNMLLSSSG